VAYAIAHVGGVLGEETLLPLVNRVGLSTSGRLTGSYPASTEEMKRMQFAGCFHNAVLSQRLTCDFLEPLSYLLGRVPVDARLSAVIAASESM